MIEIFKTNVQNKTQAKRILNSLSRNFSEAKMNFDLDDCDRILRVDGIRSAHIQFIVSDLYELGFKCEVLA